MYLVSPGRLVGTLLCLASGLTHCRYAYSAECLNNIESVLISIYLERLYRYCLRGAYIDLPNYIRV